MNRQLFDVAISNETHVIAAANRRNVDTHLTRVHALFTSNGLRKRDLLTASSKRDHRPVKNGFKKRTSFWLGEICIPRRIIREHQFRGLRLCGRGEILERNAVVSSGFAELFYIPPDDPRLCLRSQGSLTISPAKRRCLFVT